MDMLLVFLVFVIYVSTVLYLQKHLDPSLVKVEKKCPPHAWGDQGSGLRCTRCQFKAGYSENSMF